ncbi:MAG TPA: hypothetical protein DC034_14680 [Clostridium sp.]|jgi:tetratricopeptide (TPR) repeat protein|nr:hypothetical protein [Clostridium sp.]
MNISKAFQKYFDNANKRLREESIMNLLSKILFGILIMAAVFFASMFGMYKYSQFENFKNLVGQGRQCMLQKDYNKSIKLFEKALTYKNDSSVQKELLLAQDMKNQSGKQAHPNEKLSDYIKLANTAVKNHDYESANKYLDKALELSPDDQELQSMKNMVESAIYSKNNKTENKIVVDYKNVGNYQNNSVRENTDNKDKEITYDKALKIVSDKFPGASFKPAQEVLSLSILRKFLTDGQIEKYYIFYGSEVETDFQDLVLVDK